MLRLLGLLLVVTLFACSSDTKTSEVENETPIVEGPKLVPFDSLSFDMRQPEGWDFKMKLKGSDLLMFDGSCDSCNIKPVIIVMRFENKDSLELSKVVEDHINSTKEYYQEFALVNQMDTTIGELNAQRISYTAKNNQSDSLGVLSYVMLKEGEVFFINCTDNNSESKFQEQVAFFDAICQSFQFKE